MPHLSSQITQAPQSSPLAAQNGAPLPATLRAVTLNLWGESPPLERRLQLCQKQLVGLEPDIIGLQEVRQVPGKVPNTAHTLAQALGMSCAFQKTVEWGEGDEGLALLSRFPIREAGHVLLPHPMPADQRILLWALCETPAGTVLASTTHLTYRMTHGQLREDQAAAVDAAVQEVLAAQTERPAVTLLMGDFNASPDADELRFLRGLHSVNGRRTYYQDAFLTQPERPEGAAGITWARRNVFTHKLRFLESDRRIDYIFVGQASRDGRGLVHSCRVVLDEADDEGVFPSDHFGVLAEVQLTPLL
jgi:endonuclease/exonuclease/phosphatase family metal-dependent hydrolase